MLAASGNKGGGTDVDIDAAVAKALDKVLDDRVNAILKKKFGA